MLECYHPALKTSEPYLFCDYLGTPGLSSEIEGQGLVYDDSDHFGRLGKLGGLFSRFCPVRTELKQRTSRHPAGGEFTEPPGQDELLPDQSPAEDTESKDRMLRNINLDSGESFSQLCVKTHLVSPGPRSGVFGSLVTVSDGLVRIWRDWLSERAAASNGAISKPTNEEESHLRTLWLDNRRNVGLQVQVKERTWRRTAPILLHRDEGPAICYGMECEGESLYTWRQQQILNACRTFDSDHTPASSSREGPVAGGQRRLPASYGFWQLHNKRIMQVEASQAYNTVSCSPYCYNVICTGTHWFPVQQLVYPIALGLEHFLCEHCDSRIFHRLPIKGPSRPY